MYIKWSFRDYIFVLFHPLKTSKEDLLQITIFFLFPYFKKCYYLLFIFSFQSKHPKMARIDEIATIILIFTSLILFINAILFIYRILLKKSLKINAENSYISYKQTNIDDNIQTNLNVFIFEFEDIELWMIKANTWNQ